MSHQPSPLPATSHGLRVAFILPGLHRVCRGAEVAFESVASELARLEGTEITLSGATVGADMSRFRMKARLFLKDHADHIAILKLRRNEPLTPTDLSELERMFVEAGVVDAPSLDQVKSEGGLGLFVRSLVGLDREAAKAAFSEFIAERTLSADQIEFVNLIIDHLTEKGQMDPGLLYESPFTDFDPMGVSGVFDMADAKAVVAVLQAVRGHAAA